MQVELCALINKERARKGLSLLTLNPLLIQVAQDHSDYMAKKGRMAHEGIGDGTPFSRMQEGGYSFITAGECVAEGQPTNASVIAAWMGDLPHYRILMGDYKEVGFGMAKAGSTPFWTADFGTAASRAMLGYGGLFMVEATVEQEYSFNGWKMVLPASLDRRQG